MSKADLFGLHLFISGNFHNFSSGALRSIFAPVRKMSLKLLNADYNSTRRFLLSSSLGSLLNEKWNQGISKTKNNKQLWQSPSTWEAMLPSPILLAESIVEPQGLSMKCAGQSSYYLFLSVDAALLKYANDHFWGISLQSLDSAEISRQIVLEAWKARQSMFFRHISWVICKITMR